jgi:prepilin-type N-terminal cleavage/methylation domain-containing protein
MRATMSQGTAREPMIAIHTQNGRSRREREGFTLIEVLLTLAILVMIGALSWPGLSGMFASRRLRAAADQVRAEWVNMRVDAMKTESTHMFRFASLARDYRIDCNYVMEPVVDGSGLPVSTVALGPPSNGLPLLVNLLPDGVKFSDAYPEPDIRALNVVLPSDGIMPVKGGSWSDPILFYPDGSTTTIQLTLMNDRGLAIDLWLRGLTGVVTVGDLYPSTRAYE